MVHTPDDENHAGRTTTIGIVVAVPTAGKDFGKVLYRVKGEETVHKIQDLCAEDKQRGDIVEIVEPSIFPTPVNRVSKR